MWGEVRWEIGEKVRKKGSDVGGGRGGGGG